MSDTLSALEYSLLFAHFSLTVCLLMDSSLQLYACLRYPPFYGWGKRGTEGSSSLSKVTELGNSEVGTPFRHAAPRLCS